MKKRKYIIELCAIYWSNSVSLGFNYGGLIFAQMGAGIMIPFTYIIFKK